MYTSRKIKLKITEPCSENWALMTDIEKGKFCSRCQKEVVDFTGFTDAELLDYFSAAGKGQCGQLMSYQLDRTISNLPPKERTFWPKLVFSSLMTLFSTKLAVAQQVEEPIEQQPLVEIPIITINEIPPTNKESNANCEKIAPDIDRGHGSIGRVGGISLEVIEPDKEFEKQKGLLFLRSLSPW